MERGGRWRSRARHAVTRLDEIAARTLGNEPAVAPPVPDQAPEAVLGLLRHLGASMARAQDNTDRITQILEDVARVYGATGVRFFVFPTGIFVRIQTGDSTRVDFAPTKGAALRLDQIDGLYRLIDEIRHGQVAVLDADDRLQALVTSTRRFTGARTVVGTAILTLGLGMMLSPTLAALPAFLALGLLVGALRWLALGSRGVDLVLPAVASFVVTWAAFTWAGPWFDTAPLDLVIPALVTFLPGAALTMGTVELASGSMLSGSARFVYGLQRLLLLSFGIVLGVQAAGLTDVTSDAAPLGSWAPWVGVLVFAIGHDLEGPTALRTFAWGLLVLYVAYAAQFLVGSLVDPLAASFVAGAVVLPVAYAVQERKSGPPMLVTFLPSFWLLVPGALGLQGVTEIVGASQLSGLGDFVNALLTVVAIAVGVLVGTGFSERFGRATGSWRGL